MFKPDLESLRVRLGALSLACTLAVGCGGALGLFAYQRDIASFEDAFQRYVSTEGDVSTMTLGFKRQVQEWKNVLLRGYDPEQLEKYFGRFEAREAEIQAAAAHALASDLAPEARALVEQFTARHVEMGASYREGLAAFRAAQFDPEAGDRAVKGIDRAPTRMLEEAAVRVTDDALAEVGSALAAARRSLLLSWTAILLAIAVGIGAFVLVMQRLIVAPAAGLVGDLGRVARGDLATPVAPRGTGEIRSIAVSAERLRASLGELVADVSGVTVRLGEAAAELARASDSASRTVDTQHRETELIATAMTQMAASVDEVARSTVDAVDAARSVAGQGRKGREVVERTAVEIGTFSNEVASAAGVVHQLEERSQNIGAVLDVIRGIAEQTNLLALNAAIEAARAGEQGRGFAVVADEVRTLASRTQQSTQEIQTMIEDLQTGASAAAGVMDASQARSRALVEQSDEARAALVAVVEAGEQIDEMSTRIAAATEEQSTVAADINQQVNAINATAGDARDAATQTRGAGARIESFAGDLRAGLARFQI